MKVIVVGAGLAGLVCAAELLKANVEVVVYEASDDVGGRVRTDIVDGFKIDRGFQVLFDAYPSAQRHLDLPALSLQPFDPGAVVCRNGRQVVLTDPTRDASRRDVFAALTASILTPADKLRALNLSRSLVHGTGQTDIEFDDRSTEDYLDELGFSDSAIDFFFRPFYGGIFLDRTLGATAAAFRFYFRMLSRGSAALPAEGMGAIAKMLAAPLDAAGAIRRDSPVRGVAVSNNFAVGITLENGETAEANVVVLAASAPDAARITSVDVPDGSLAATSVYFAGDRPVSSRRKLFLNASPDAYVNNVQPLSTVAPSYAPSGRCLLGASILGLAAEPDEIVYQRVRAEIDAMFASDREAVRALASYSPLCIRRIPYAQFPQPPGLLGRLPGFATEIGNLFVAGEWTQGSSIHGALTSGEVAARAVLASASVV